MQVATSTDYPQEPLKLNKSDSEGLSVVELETVPLKKRLEILFISNIIPSRRQLAFKYGLDEQVIHNVLSHRVYILQNWKYNANTERLLTKPELENAMAFMELLIEWKRRVQLNGLQMTHAALLRKTMALQKILEANTLQISDNWWQLFNENWEHKQFRDSENDSLEFEDILNDIQWMFHERTFNRLATRLRRARIGSRTRIKRETKDIGDGVCIDEAEADTNDLLDMSDIKAEPLYYNDDDFECEDYEFVLDEELVCESLRRELADVEEAKYQHFIGADNVEHVYANEEDKTEETQQIIEDFEVTKSESLENIAEADTETKTDIVLEEFQDNSDFFNNSLTPTISIDPIWPMIDQKAPVPIKLEIVNPITNQTLEIPAADLPKPVPKPFRRKPRNLHAVLTVRKDCVRLPNQMEVAQFVTRKFENQEIDEVTNESNAAKQTSKRKRNGPLKTTPKKKTTISRSPSPSFDMPIIFDDVTFVGNEQIIESAEPVIISIPSSDEAVLEPPTMVLKADLQDISSLLKTEKDSMPSTNEISIPAPGITKQDMIEADANDAALNVKNNANDFHVQGDDEELILGISPIDLVPSVEFTTHTESLASQDHQQHQGQEPICERRKQKFKDKLKITSVQILELDRKDSEPVIEDKPQAQSIRNNQRQVAPEKKSSQKSAMKNTVKRIKRRTDDSDLTLRRDKVRIGSGHVTIANKIAENISP